MAKVTPCPDDTKRQPSGLTSDYCSALHCKHRRIRDPGQGDSLPVSSRDSTQDEGLKRLKDVGDKRTLITAAELGLVQQYRELKQAGQEVLQVDFPYHYSSILYACYGNQYKILQLVEREFSSGTQELTLMHTTPCWIGKNSAMVAAYQGHLETMLYIIDLDLQGKFGDVDLFKQRDIMGKTAMGWAASQGHTDTIEALVIRSLYKLLPHDSDDPLVIRTRWKLVSLLAELSKQCRDYDPSCDRHFFQEVLAWVGFSPEAAAAAEAAEAAVVGVPGGPLGKNADLVGSSWDMDDEIGGSTAVRSLPDDLALSLAFRGGVAGGGSGAAAAANKTGSSGRSQSSMTRPSGTAKDVHITVGMLMDVVTSAYHAGMNCMGSSFSSRPCSSRPTTWTWWPAAPPGRCSCWTPAATRSRCRLCCAPRKRTRRSRWPSRSTPSIRPFYPTSTSSKSSPKSGTPWV